MKKILLISLILFIAVFTIYALSGVLDCDGNKGHGFSIEYLDRDIGNAKNYVEKINPNIISGYKIDSSKEVQILSVPSCSPSEAPHPNPIFIIPLLSESNKAEHAVVLEVTRDGEYKIRNDQDELVGAIVTKSKLLEFGDKAENNIYKTDIWEGSDYSFEKIPPSNINGTSFSISPKFKTFHKISTSTTISENDKDTYYINQTFNYLTGDLIFVGVYDIAKQQQFIIFPEAAK